jgi:hypothetical protein
VSQGTLGKVPWVGNVKYTDTNSRYLRYLRYTVCNIIEWFVGNKVMRTRSRIRPVWPEETIYKKIQERNEERVAAGLGIKQKGK